MSIDDLPPLGMLTADLPGAKGVRETRQLWHAAKLRRAARCEDCKEPLAVGTVAYAPLTNASNRYHRLCVVCARRLAARVLGGTP